MNYQLYNTFKIVFETPDDGYTYFFGYYDKTPLNKANDKLLAHRVSFDGRDVKDGDIAEVGYFDLPSKKFIKVDETLAWNWQQGSHLQWLPPNFKNEIIYNSIKDNKFISVIYNIKTQERKIIPFPIYTIHPNGKEALAINYECFYWRRHGYRYENIKNPKWNKPYHEEDGIFKVDLITGKVKRIIDTTEIVNNHKLPGFEKFYCWFECLDYNPSGRRFSFLHRWRDNSKESTRIYTANSYDGSNLFMYPDVRFYSHFYWKNNQELTIWSLEPFDNISSIQKKLKNSILKTRKSKNIFLGAIRFFLKRILPKRLVKIYFAKSKLLNYVDKTTKYTVIGEGLLSKKGHNSWGENSIILNDSYEDKYSYRHLELFDTKNNKLIKVGRFYSYYNSDSYRCDLHPRFSIDNKFIIIDSAHTKNRKILLIKNIIQINK